MKQLKYLAMLLFAAVMSLSFAACSSDDDDDNNGGETKTTKSELKDNGSELSWTETVTNGNQKATNTHRFAYKGEVITSYTTVSEFPTAAAAQQALDELKSDPEMKSAYEKLELNGKTLTIKYNLGEGSPLEGLTKEVVKYMYEQESNALAPRRK